MSSANTGPHSGTDPRSGEIEIRCDSPAQKRCCGRCTHFRNDPATIEAAFPGLTAMSSGSASVRSHDGLCLRHEVYLSFHDICDDFQIA
ncbi:MAG TPA: hypothetical protein VGM54_11210 [Chthoniobacter sp.]|jgi:hypothetical protein